MLNVEMQLVPPIEGPALNVVRQASQRAAALASRLGWQCVAKKVQTQHADPPEQLWEIPEGNERKIIDAC